MLHSHGRQYIWQYHCVHVQDSWYSIAVTVHVQDSWYSITLTVHVQDC